MSRKNFVDKEKLKELNSQGYSNKYIAEYFQVARNTISMALKRLGLKSNDIYPPLKIIDEFTAECSKCNKILPLDKFETCRSGKKYEYKISYCKSCRLNKKIEYRNKNTHAFLCKRYTDLKSTALKNNINFTLTKEEFINQFEKQGGKCFYTEKDMILVGGKGKNMDALSVDKIIPEKGYVSNNFVFCTNKINIVKFNLSLKEMEVWTPVLYNKIIMHLKECNNE